VFGKQRSLTLDDAPVDVDRRARAAALGAVGVLSFAILTWVGANIYVPLHPVPITLQTLFVLLAGSVVGGRLGSLSQWLYVGVGAAGIPVFAGGLSGWGVVAGPTGGYIAAFLVTPWIVSNLVSRSNTVAWQTATFSVGTLVIFVLGVSHLALFYTHDIGMAVRLGFLPFVPGAVLKIIAAVSIHRSFTALERGRSSKHRS
jgi:biotin transport system substrate-specific component